MADRPTTTLTTEHDSELISAIRIIMIIGLVFHHLFAIPNSEFFPRRGLDSETLSLANLLNGLIHWGTMAAVPLLSIISGYLYFARAKVQHAALLKKRIKSILLPSLVWTSFWLSFGYVLAKMGRPYDLFQWLDYGLLANSFSWLTLLNGIIGVTEHPLAYQFWFIHDLLLTLLLAPIIGWLSKRAGLGFILILTAVWLLDAVPFPFFSANVLYFFCLGALFAIRGHNLASVAEAGLRWRKIFLGLFCFLLLTRIGQEWHPLFASYQWLCLLRLAGVATLGLYIYSQLQQPNSLTQRISAYSPYAFFIFATHYPAIDLFKILFEYLPGQPLALGQFLSLLIIPIATVTFCILSARIVAWISPRTFAFLNGGKALYTPAPQHHIAEYQPADLEGTSKN